MLDALTQHFAVHGGCHVGLEDALDPFPLGGCLAALAVQALMFGMVVEYQHVADRRAGLVPQRREPMLEMHVSTPLQLAYHLEALNRGAGLAAIVAEDRAERQHEAG